ncbi:tyrosine-type recombinase/integrase [Streptomyces sp. MBT65]|uniref:tyrosine-type recombinase/integrase n=1 Tax=Streptomyces sp. MBT65 TaxID=1488395 RepID=UPI00190A4B31|nr:tyrosine-type recombinase/integrase [Streptomyces sp. MBT65]MBK3575934.1 tyrosine-type recombinase/integrase [Streptomyces sp. MBT65]
MFDGSVYKRCKCTEPKLDDTGQPIPDASGRPKTRELGSSCPLLKKREHGTWYYYVKLPDGVGGQRRRPRKGGFLTQTKAKEEAQKLWDEAQGGVNVESKETVAQYLNRWHDKRVDLKRSTRSDYRDFIDRILIPALGHLSMRELRDRHIQEMFKQIWAFNKIKEANRIAAQQAKAACDAAHQAWRKAPTPRPPELRQTWHQAREALKEARTKPRQDTGPGRQKKYLDCLSAALSDAVTEKLITQNWAKLVTIPKYERPEALVWTEERVARWRETGEKPSPVMVWTPEQTGEFLDAAVEQGLYIMWHLMAFRAPRRGEATGLPWSELDMTKGVAHISEQIVTDSTNAVWEDTPKSSSGRRAVALDYATFALLTAWRDVQKAQRAEWESKHQQWLDATPQERQGQALKAYDHPYVDSGKVFTLPDGRPHHPKNVSQAFDRFIKRLGFPPIRLHDLRHCAASLSLAAGLSMKAIQVLLGHSSYQLTADTYTSLMPQFEQAAADAPLDLVPRRNGINKPDDTQQSATETDAEPPAAAAPAAVGESQPSQIADEPYEEERQTADEPQAQPSRSRGHLRLVSSVPRDGAPDAA